MEVGQTYSRFTIESVGEVDLQFYELNPHGGDTFYLPEVWKMTRPSQRTKHYHDPHSGSPKTPAKGSMRIKNNDSNSVELLIPLIAAPVGWEGSTDTGASKRIPVGRRRLRNAVLARVAGASDPPYFGRLKPYRMAEWWSRATTEP